MIEFTDYNNPISFDIPIAEYKKSEGASVTIQGKHSWGVTSQGSNKNYIVGFENNGFKCTCPYNEHKHKLCKHIAAVMRTSKKATINIIRG